MKQIHPFFTQVLSGIVPISSEGHYYNGEIAKAQWIDAQHLQKGYPFISTYRKLSPVPSIVGNTGDNILSGITEDKSKVLLEQYKNKGSDK